MYIFRIVVGIRGKDGVVFGVEKFVILKFYEVGVNKRLFNIDRYIGIVSRYIVFLMLYLVIMWYLVVFIIINRINNLKEKLEMYYMKSFKELMFMLFCLKIKIFCNGSFIFIVSCDFYIFVNVFL